MKILHAIPSFGSGGAERLCMLLCAELGHLGHDVHIAYIQPVNSEYMKRLEAANITLHWLGMGSSQNIWRAQKDPRVLWRLHHLVQQLRPEIVQSWNRPMDVFVGLLSQSRNFRWVISEMSSAQMYQDRRELMRLAVAKTRFSLRAHCKHLKYFLDRLHGR